MTIMTTESGECVTDTEEMAPMNRCTNPPTAAPASCDLSKVALLPQSLLLRYHANHATEPQESERMTWPKTGTSEGAWMVTGSTSREECTMVGQEG